MIFWTTLIHFVEKSINPTIISRTLHFNLNIVICYFLYLIKIEMSVVICGYIRQSHCQSNQIIRKIIRKYSHCSFAHASLPLCSPEFFFRLDILDKCFQSESIQSFWSAIGWLHFALNFTELLLVYKWLDSDLINISS